MCTITHICRYFLQCAYVGEALCGFMSEALSAQIYVISGMRICGRDTIQFAPKFPISTP